MADDHPTSVDAAVRVLQGMIPEDEQAKIAVISEDELTMLHFGLGQWIRNNFGLWQGNPQLLASTGQTHPDDASGVIIHAFWQRLRDDLPRLH